MILSSKRFLQVLSIILLMFISVAGCGSKDPLLGTWQEPNSGVEMVLGGDGKVVMSLNGNSFSLGYKTEDPNVLIFLASADGTIPEQRMTYRLKEDKLVLTLDGADTVFYRLK